MFRFGEKIGPEEEFTGPEILHLLSFRLGGWSILTMTIFIIKIITTIFSEQVVKLVKEGMFL